MEVSEVARELLKKLAKIEKRLTNDQDGLSGEQGRLVSEYFSTLNALVDELINEKVESLKLIARSWKLVLLPYIIKFASKCDPIIISSALHVYIKCDEIRQSEKVKIHAAIHGQIKEYALGARNHLLGCLEADEGMPLMFLQLCLEYEWFYEALKIGALLSDVGKSQLESFTSHTALIVKSVLFDDLKSEKVLIMIKQGLPRMFKLKPTGEIAQLVEGLGFALWYREAYQAVILFYESIIVNLPQNWNLGGSFAFWAIIFLKSLRCKDLKRIRLSTWVFLSGSLNSVYQFDRCQKSWLKLALQKRMNASQLLTNTPTGAECWVMALEILQEFPELGRYLRLGGETFVLGPSILNNAEEDLSRVAFSVNSHTSQPVDISVESMKEEIEKLRIQKDSLSQAMAQSKSGFFDTVYVLDTNVLIDRLAFIDQLLKENPIRIAIPSFVILELDGLVKSSRQGKSAEIAAKYLDQVGGMSLRGGIHGINVEGRLTKFFRHPEGQRDYFPRSAQVCNIDDAILHIVKQIKNAIVISDDVNLGLKGQAMQVKVLSWNSFHRLFRS